MAASLFNSANNDAAYWDAYYRKHGMENPANKASGTSAASPAAPASSPNISVGSITSPFQQAINSLTAASGDVERTYQEGKRRTLSDIAMQSINTGMANTLNMPAAGVAYDQANRAGTNVAVAGQKAGVLTSLGQALAGVRDTDVGSATSLTASQIAANTSTQNANLQYALGQQTNALEQYLKELELKYKYGGGSGVSAASMSSLFG